MVYLFEKVEWSAIPMYMQVLAGIVAATWLIQMLYYLIPFWRLTRKRNAVQPDTEIEKTLPISIVVCAHNEKDALTQLLPALLAQDYPEFEVLVVNNSSTDDTETFLSILKLSEPRLECTTIEPDMRFYHDNKLAMTVGIKGAKYRHILFTEADCMPPSPNWLRSMQAGFASGHQLVLGYCRNIAEQQDGLWFRRCESVFSALMWLRAAHAGKPYRGTTKNMGITRDLFMDNKGFSNLNHMPLSEASLFLSKAGNKSNTTVALSPDAIMTTTRRTDHAAWMLERRRHASLFALGNRGACMQGAELGSRVLYYLTLMVLVVQAVCGLYQPALLLVLVPLVLLRLTFRAVVLRRTQRLLHERKLFFGLLAYDWIAPFFALFVSLTKPSLNKLKKVGR